MSQVTISHVARKAGVSESTVSRVLNGTARVAATKRRAVEIAIQETGFQPNAFARGLATGRSNAVGVVTQAIDSPFYGEGMRGIERTLQRALQDASSGRLRQAIDSVRVAMRLSPNDPAGIRVLGMLLVQANEFEQALQVMQRAVAQQSRHLVLQAEGDPGAERHRAEAQVQQAVRRPAALQQPAGRQVADNVDERDQRRQRAGLCAGQAGLGVDGRQKADDREPLRRVAGEGRADDPRARRAHAGAQQRGPARPDAFGGHGRPPRTGGFAGSGGRGGGCRVDPSGACVAVGVTA